MGTSFIIIIEADCVFDVRLYAICVSSLIVFLFLFVLLGEEDWDSVVKYRHVNKEKK